MAKKNNLVVTVMARDRVGIVADVTGAIFRLGGNVDAMSQTVMRGYFTIIITTTLPATVGAERLRQVIEASGEPGELTVGIKKWERSAQSQPVVEDTDIFVLSIMGKDRAGLIAQISNFMLSRNINIVDLYAYADNGKMVFISQLMVPRALDIGQLKIDLQGLFKKSDVTVHFQHENIFLAIEHVDFPGGPN